jgi:hypothetical protein
MTKLALPTLGVQAPFHGPAGVVQPFPRSWHTSRAVSPHISRTLGPSHRRDTRLHTYIGLAGDRKARLILPSHQTFSKLLRLAKAKQLKPLLKSLRQHRQGYGGEIRSGQGFFGDRRFAPLRQPVRVKGNCCSSV